MKKSAATITLILFAIFNANSNFLGQEPPSGGAVFNDSEVTDSPKPVSDPTTASDLRLSARGTGNTTGHILDLTLVNDGTEDLLINIPPYYIPPTGDYQSYIAPYPQDVTVPGNSEKTVPIQGYCADVNTPPVPAGTPATKPEDWVEPRLENFDREGLVPELVPNLYSKPISPEEAEGIFYGSVSELQEPGYQRPVPTNVLARDLQEELFETTAYGEPYIIGKSGDRQTEIPVFSFDPHHHPQKAADVFYDAVTKIEDAVDDLRRDGLINTPFSNDPQREREALIQQTFWIFTSLISGTTYEFDHFRTQLKEQFSEIIGMDIGEAPEPMKEQFESGADSFWDSFNLVGEKARVFKGTGKKESEEEEDPTAVFEEADAPPAPEPEPTEPVVEEPPCDCGEVTFSPMRIVDAHTGEEITADTLSTLTDQIDFYPPDITTECPDYCYETNYARIWMEPDYKYIRRTGTIRMASKQQIRVHGPCKKTFNSIYSATCEGSSCIIGEESREIYFLEDNDCCHEIRKNNRGRLSFNLDGMSVLLSGNSIHMLSDRGETKSFSFPYNVEALFCNAEPDRIFSYSRSVSEQRGDAGEHSSASVSIDNNPAGAFGPYYSILFGAQQNGSEYSFSMSASPEDDCKIFVQVWKDGELLESINQYD